MTQKEILEAAITEAGSLTKLSQLSGLAESRLSEWRKARYSIGYDKLSTVLKAVNLKITLTK